jgi:hypothetical protein
MHAGKLPQKHKHGCSTHAGNLPQKHKHGCSMHAGKLPQKNTNMSAARTLVNCRKHPGLSQSNRICPVCSQMWPRAYPTRAQWPIQPVPHATIRTIACTQLGQGETPCRFRIVSTRKRAAVRSKSSKTYSLPKVARHSLHFKSGPMRARGKSMTQ